MTPLATLRIQFNADYTFADAMRDVPAFAKLGISHLYASPVWTASPASTHGYDVVDPGTVSETLGGEAGLRQLHDRLKAHGMGLIVDIVPNHMGNGQQNRWWQDVLRRGKQSPYASYFDIDWDGNADVPAGKVLLPVLPEPLADILFQRKLSVVRGVSGHASLAYDGARWPLAPETVALAQAARTAQHWRLVLARQHFHLTHWSLARDALNWRRFFDITSLVAVRVERPEVFDAVHGLLLRLFADGVIDGVRVDHVDGLSDPGAYCRRLRAALRKSGDGREPWIVVEKILMDGERLDTRWETDGTTGYDFMNDVGALLHDGDGADELCALWRNTTGDTQTFEKHVRDARWQLIDERFGSEMNRVTKALTSLIAADPGGRARDAGIASFRRCAGALAASFPVYRCYPDPSNAADAPNDVLMTAMGGAKRRLHPLDHTALAQLVQWLTPTEGNPPGWGELLRDLQIRFAQLTAPLAAKAVEDTAGYRWGRLLSRNEVGSRAAELSLPLADFHRANTHRASHWPRAMLSTATHDHKRGEDVRARLAVLSEIPAQWAEAVSAWRAENERFRESMLDAPDSAHELMLYQTLAGAWPCAWRSTPSGAPLHAFVERIAQWQRKAAREAGVRTSWLAPDAAYEAACDVFLTRIMGAQSFVESMHAFANRIGPAGALNGLTQLFLRLTCPGVPDTYQASLQWDQTLVDPDNRRAVHFDVEMSGAPVPGAVPDRQQWQSLMDRWRDGDVKFSLLCALLHWRKQFAPAFTQGDYVPLTAHGPCAAQVVAFARVPAPAVGSPMVCVATRHTARHLGALSATASPVPRVRPQDWQDTAVDVSVLSCAPGWRSLIDGVRVRNTSDMLPLADILAALPVALLVPE
ncbi:MULTISPECIES: malto-oligosyltrehalose synthase [Pandoraea]|uniref:malto-oligosyltrehalose synthase n=1 Tax=Pandoraea TaxID=93217 RepID=UPI001F5DD78A|nr:MULTISPECIES: malto-oligosyltrehalose synthase [Pandoraea]MCI3208077.1 malto-oligosyltrehalose synthase [Pandoraea sp. LA3]MDN4586106.1 malto-oligosyltrehalose synthase [Pandoraea capi]